MTYQFKNPALERQALTHPSCGAPHNERLAWLGDAVLYRALSDILWQRFPQLGAGGLTDMRASLARNDALAAAARRTGFPQRIRVHGAVCARGGEDDDLILAGALEAYLAAATLDGADPMEVIEELMGEDIAARGKILAWRGKAGLRDPALRLEEFLRDAGQPPPVYREEEKYYRGAIGFRVTCEVNGKEFSGVGKSKYRAKKTAAGRALSWAEHGIFAPS